MNRTLITLALCSITSLSASDVHLNSPTRYHQNNFDRIQELIKDAIAEKAEIKGQLSLLDYSDQLDTSKPNSDKLVKFQLKKDVLRTQYNQDLQVLKKKIKRLKRQQDRLNAVQIN